MRQLASLTVCALLLANTANAASLCDDLARPIQQGKLNDSESGHPLTKRLAKAEPGLITLNEERFKRSVPKPFPMPEHTDSASYQPFGDSGVVAIKSVSGTAHCESWEFYERKGKRTVNFPHPPGFSSGEGDLCWTSYAQVGAIHGTPILFEESDEDYAQSLTLFPLHGRKWGPRCGINVEFASTLRIDNAYCKSGTCPANLSGKALKIAQSYNSKSAQPDQITGPDAAKIQSLSSAVQLKILPRFGIDSTNPYIEFSGSQAFALSLDGKPSLAVVGGGLFGWRDYSGVLVAFWQVAGDQLVPLAGFQIEKTNQTVKKISVTSP
jgi:hypothetical protein